MQILVSVWRASMDSTSFDVSSNFSASKFSCRRFLLDDFGIGTTPCWIYKNKLFYFLSEQSDMILGRPVSICQLIACNFLYLRSMLSVILIELSAMPRRHMWGVEVYFHAFLTSHWLEVSRHLHATVALLPVKEPRNLVNRGWVDPRDGLQVCTRWRREGSQSLPVI
jgi:hypothetical protein